MGEQQHATRRILCRNCDEITPTYPTSMGPECARCGKVDPHPQWMTEPMTETTCRAAAEADELRAALEMVKAERDAIVRLCYHSNEPPDGQWFYRLKVDPIDGTEMETDYDTVEEAQAAVRAAAGLDGEGHR
jgi:NMD protein affecting ribosome stability and mRNA decay